MNGTETAVVQIGSIAITSGAAIGILKWLVPYIIQLWADKQKEVAADKRKNLTMSMELEQAKKQNSDDAIRANRAMVEILSTAVKSISSDVSSLKAALAHTDLELAGFASYVPLLERIKAILEGIDRKTNRSVAPAGSTLQHTPRQSAAPATAADGDSPPGVTPTRGAGSYPTSKTKDLPEGNVRVSEQKPPPRKPGTDEQGE